MEGLILNLGLTASLVRQMRIQGIDAVPMKVIQTGCGYTEDGYPVSPDFEVYCSASSFIRDEDGIRDMVPLSFVAPCSPHLASRMEGAMFDIVPPVAVALITRKKRTIHRHWRCSAIIVGGVFGLGANLMGLDMLAVGGMAVSTALSIAGLYVPQKEFSIS